MDTASLTAIIAGSGYLTRNIIEKLKKQSWFANADALEITLASYVINFILTLIATFAYASYNGTQLDHMFIHATVATIVSALYHDFRETVTSVQSPANK